jgi:hypothetical protein
MLHVLIFLFILFLVVGVITYFAPIDARMKNIIYTATGAVTFIVILVWALQAFGLVNYHGVNGTGTLNL